MTDVPRLHADQFDITTDLARRLVAEQFPVASGLPLVPVASTGTVTAIFRCGDELAVRLPLQPGTSAAELDQEHEASRVAAAALAPLRVVEPVFVGEPTADYPSPWTVVRWLPGRPVTTAEADTRFARDLAGGVRRLRALPLDGRTRRGTGRGGLLADVDAATREWLDENAALIEATPGLSLPGLLELWEDALAAPADDPWTWQHGDLMPGNLLVRDGRLTAVIDWSTCDVGDPAYDLMPAWNLFEAGPREVFLSELGADEAAVLRSRGWALAQAIGGLGYYRETNPGMARLGEVTLRRILC